MKIVWKKKSRGKAITVICTKQMSNQLENMLKIHVKHLQLLVVVKVSVLPVSFSVKCDEIIFLWFPLKSVEVIGKFVADGPHEPLTMWETSVKS